MLVVELCAARASRVFCTEQGIRTENAVLIENQNGLDWFYIRSSIARGGFIIRAQSRIRADGVRPRNEITPS
jgi:hypothetical protein